MKLKAKIIGAAACAFALCVALAGCAGAPAGNDAANFQGDWILTSGTVDGQEATEETLAQAQEMGLSVYLQLNEGGSAVLSVLGTYFNGLVLDHFIFDQNIKRRVCIITKKEEELRHFILTDLHSGATVYESYGAYNMEKRREIITIVDKGEYQKLMNFMNREDPQAFITVYTVSDMRYQPKT